MDAALDMQADVAEREVHFERFVHHHLKRNYLAHYLHGMLGMTGFRLVNAPTFLPAYLHLLSGSKTVVGFGLSLSALGTVLSPVLGATHIEHRERVLPVAVFIGVLMRLQILGIALAGWVLAGRPLLIATLCFLFLFGLFTGAQRVAFQLLLGKVIPVTMRGRLQAWRNMSGGMVAAALSYFAGEYLVGKNALGNGYGTTFLLAFVLTSLGLTALSLLMREPVPPTLRTQMSFLARVAEFPRLLEANRGLRFFLLAQTLAVAGRIASPFYVLYVSKHVALTGANLGLLSLAYLGADTGSNLIWGYLGDRVGFRAGLVAALSLWIGATLLLTHATAMPLIFVSFCGLGAAQSGYMMSVSTMILEFGQRDDMAMRLALSTTAEGIMAALGPLLGGFVAARFGYVTVFDASIACELGALCLLMWFVDEPRRRREHARGSQALLR